MTTDQLPDRSQTREDLLVTGDERLRELIYGSTSGEFANSVNRKPATYPLTPFYDDKRGVIVITTPVAFVSKAGWS